MINNTPSQLFTSLNPNQSAEASRSRNVSDMGSDDFLALAIAQMKNQDPTKPMDRDGIHEPASAVRYVVRCAGIEWLIW